MLGRTFSRREFLRASAAVGAGLAVLAGCQPKIVEVEKVVTKEVEKEVVKEVVKEVEKEITRVVEKEIIVKDSVLPWKYQPLGGEPFDGEPITLEYWDWHRPRVEMMERWFRIYSDMHPNVTFNPTTLPVDFWPKLQAAIPAGTAPDFHQFHQSRHQAFAWGGLLAPFPEELFPMSDVSETYISLGGWLGPNGRAYWLPLGAMSNVVYYNKDMFEAEGLTADDIPGTWDELRDFAKSLTKFDAAGRVEIAGLTNFDGYLVEDFMWRNQGIWHWDEGYTRKCYAQEEIIDSLQYMLDLRDVHHLTDPDFLPYLDAFVAGKTYMTLATTWVDGWLVTNAPNVNFGAVIHPTITGEPGPCAGDGWPDPQSSAVPSTTSPDRAAVAFDVIAWLFSNPEHIIDNCITLGSPPAIPQLVTHPILMANESIAAVAPRTEWLVYNNQQGAPLADDAYNRLLKEAIFKQGVPVREAVYSFQAELDRITNEYVDEVGPENFQISERAYFHADKMRFGDCLV